VEKKLCPLIKKRERTSYFFTRGNETIRGKVDSNNQHCFMCAASALNVTPLSLQVYLSLLNNQFHVEPKQAGVSDKDPYGFDTLIRRPTIILVRI
jgi:hypothetical protein